MYVIIDNLQVKGKSTGESSPHYMFTFGLNTLKSEQGNIMLDVPDFELS